MPVTTQDVGHVVTLLAGAHHRATYGVIGAAIITRVGHPGALPGNYGQSTGQSVNRFFNGKCGAASWAVAVNGFPTDYDAAQYDPAWNTNTPLHADVQTFLDWLDDTFPGWDGHLVSVHP
jgi:hypothetical protein